MRPSVRANISRAYDRCVQQRREKENAMRDTETWNCTTSTDSLILHPISSTAQNESKTLIGRKTDTTECAAKCEVHNSRYETEHSCKRVRNRAFVQRSLLCSDYYLPNVKPRELQISVCASPPKFNPVSLSWRAAAALVWMRQHEQKG